MCSSLLFAESKKKDVTIKVSDGVINMTENYILITASGTPDLNISNIGSAMINAEESAKKNLINRLEKAFLKLPLINKMTLEKYLSNKKEKHFFTSLMKNENFGNPVSSRHYSDGSVDLQYKIPLDKFLKYIKEKTMTELSVSAKEKNVFLKNLSESSENQKEALVVEIKDKKFEPALYLALENEKGELFYSTCFNEKTAMVVGGEPSYFLKKLNAVESFMTVSAIKVKDGSTLILKNSDLEQIAKKMKKESLKAGNIIFLVK
ncbi:MAG: hypothetical protein ACOX2F_06180 [bacterium]